MPAAYCKKFVKRSFDFATDRAYRRVLLSRVVLFLLRCINSQVSYVGLNAGGEKTFLFANDNAITPYAISAGGFQKDDLLRVLRFLKQEDLLRPGAFVDIGANIGTQTVYAMHTKSFSRAYCFEPVARNVEMLRLNIFANHLTEAVNVVPMAVSDSQREITIALSSANSGDNRINDKTSASFENRELIHCTTLDDYFTAQGVKPQEIALLWMDTQGHEAQVLQGARQTLQGGMPAVIEFWPWALREGNSYDTLVRLIQENFHFFCDLKDKRLTKRSVKELTGYADHHLGDENWFTDLILCR